MESFPALRPSTQPAGELSSLSSALRLRCCLRRRSFFQEAPNCFGRLCSLAQPHLGPLAVEDELRRMAARVVVPQDFDESPITRPFSINHHDSVTDLLFGSGPSQSDP